MLTIPIRPRPVMEVEAVRTQLPFRTFPCRAPHKIVINGKTIVEIRCQEKPLAWDYEFILHPTFSHDLHGWNLVLREGSSRYRYLGSGVLRENRCRMPNISCSIGSQLSLCLVREGKKNH